ncbi:hypothetical protein E3N88_29437 [Mikania micrantha]|uniref:Uncharacterized protein n=1 Tax=Mikania micrantha TaxID=192012 RepID=A0A5N6MLP4_9ASTR|nr:hypothetical protein E3N88_29437 [Mikania micrantha]
MKIVAGRREGCMNAGGRGNINLTSTDLNALIKKRVEEEIAAHEAARHIKKDCPHLKNNNNNENNNGQMGRTLVIGTTESRNDLNLATGTYLLNDHYTSVLFDTETEESLIFKHLSKYLS